jgi:glycerophosphoryl diester phosphodiesterase
LVIEVECKEIGLAAGLRVLFERFGGAQRCILFSGEPEVVEELAAEFPAGPGERRRPDGPRIGANIRRLSRGMWSDIERLCLDVIDLNAFECERGELDELHRGGFEVLSNLGDLPDWWQVIRDWGFDGFKTNYPEEYTAWRQLPARRS